MGISDATPRIAVQQQFSVTGVAADLSHLHRDWIAMSSGICTPVFGGVRAQHTPPLSFFFLELYTLNPHEPSG